MTDPKTPGEQLFEDYLRLYGYGFEFEKGQPGATKRPDYSVNRNGLEVLCEVKDFEAQALSGNRSGVYDPYPRIRAKIEAAREKFKEYKGLPCCLVMFNQGNPFADIERPEVVLGAMYGDAGVTFSVDMKTGKAAAPAEFTFLGRGKMTRPHWHEPQNTTISALITVRRVAVGRRRLQGYLREHPGMNHSDILALTDDKVGFKIEERQLGVIVWENGVAATPLSREIFDGPYDTRWGIEGNDQRITHRGEKLPDDAS